jgi:hypothetical protein
VGTPRRGVSTNEIVGFRTEDHRALPGIRTNRTSPTYNRVLERIFVWEPDFIMGRTDKNKAQGLKQAVLLEISPLRPYETGQGSRMPTTGGRQSQETPRRGVSTNPMENDGINTQTFPRNARQRYRVRRGEVYRVRCLPRLLMPEVAFLRIDNTLLE